MHIVQYYYKQLPVKEYEVVAIESLVSGTPLITTHNGAMPEIIEHGKQGFLCNTKYEMVEAIKNIENIKPADCFIRVNEVFHYRKMAEKYIDIYKKYVN